MEFEFFGYKVVAVKPYSGHPDDSYLFTVIRKNNRGFVVHTYNRTFDGFSNGSYCDDLATAIGVFNRR